MKNPFQEVAEKIKKLNDYYKDNEYKDNIEEIIKSKVEEISDFAKENNVPVRLSVSTIINNVKNTDAGEEEEYEESSEEYEDSDY